MKNGQKIALSDADLKQLHRAMVIGAAGLPTHWDAEVIAAAGKRLTEMGPAVVIITLGAQGSLLRLEGEDTLVPPCKVKPVDTTAAGDTYCGALATARLEGMDWKDAVKFATAASAISVTRMGAQPSIPLRGEIDEFMRKQGC